MKLTDRSKVTLESGFDLNRFQVKIASSYKKGCANIYFGWARENCSTKNTLKVDIYAKICFTTQNKNFHRNFRELAYFGFFAKTNFHKFMRKTKKMYYFRKNKLIIISHFFKKICTNSNEVKKAS